MTSIGDCAFLGTAWYDNQPEGLVYIGKIAYCYKGTMPSNTNIVLNEGTMGIASNAFSNCTGLTSIIIPNSVTSIGEYVFSGCSGLTSIIIPNSVTSIGEYVFSGCSGLTSITIGNSVTSIGRVAFSGCSGLTSISIPNSVKSIGERAFYGCNSLKKVTINSSVTNIGSSAFIGCNYLQSIYCLGSNPPTCKNTAFSLDVYTNSILHVPVGSYDTYSSAFNWSNFKRIVADIESTNSINDIRQNLESVVYDLQGRRVEQPQRGLHIRDGKKVVIR